MEILDILKILNFVITLMLLVYAYLRLKDLIAKIMIVTTYLFFTLSSLMYVSGEIAAGTDWLKHGLFFIGQISFFLFLKRITDRKIADEEKELQKTTITELPKSVEVAVGDAGDASISQPTQAKSIHLIAWVGLLTEQGLQHILALPIHFLIYSLVRVRFAFVKSSSFKRSLNLFLAASLFFAMVHAGEFIIESQHILPILEGDPIEYIEFGWLYLGALFVFLGIRSVNEE